MPARNKYSAGDEGYVLQITGEQDECGNAEDVYRFHANAAARSGGVDLCSIHGLLIQHQGGDLGVKLIGKENSITDVMHVELYTGTMAQNAVSGPLEFQVRIEGRIILFLHSPNVKDIDDLKEPGSRLISLLKKHFAGRDMQVVVDLGTPDEDNSFRDYFFPRLDLLGLRFLDHRLALGRWGHSERSDSVSYFFGASYQSC